jgi:hypothetical protein
MSFARNFAAGQEIAQRGIDTYRDAKQRRALGRVADAKPEESQGYTAQDGEHLSAIANAKDADGNPYYSVEPGANGGYGIRSNFQVQGDDGSMGTPGMAPMGPRTVTDFLGQRTEGSLSAGGIDAARGRAYADVISSTDPVKGLQMRRDAATMERENARFQAEEEMRPLQRRAAELQVSGGERNERVGVRSDLLTTIDDQIAQMPDDALKVYASQVNTNNTDLPMLFIGKTKDGFQFLSRDPKTGEPGTKPMTYSAAQMRDLARVSIYASAGFGKESQNLLKETSKELYDMLYKDAQLTETTVRSGNDALGKQTGLELDRAKLADAQRRTGVAANQAGTQSRNLKEYVNAKGETVLVDTSMLRAGPDGVVPIPAGLRPKTARPEISTRDLLGYSTELQNTVNVKTGKPFTPEEALTEAKRILSGQEDPWTARLNAVLGDGGTDPFATTTPPQPSQVPGGATGVRPTAQRIGTLVPPRSRADMEPRKPMSDDDIIRNYLSK